MPNLKNFVVPFLTANGALAGIVVGLFQIDAIAQYVGSNLLPMWGLVAAVELITAASVWLIYRSSSPSVSGILAFDSGIDRITIRNATQNDTDGTESVYREFFSESLSIDDCEFNRIVAREVHVRVAEATYQDGSKEIMGYYSVWPMAHSAYRNLVEGKIKESSFTSAMVVSPKSKNAEVLYVSEICARRGSGGVGTMLLKDARSYLNAIARQNQKIGLIAAWGSTTIGRSIATRMCMTRVATTRGKLTRFYEISRREAFKVVGNAAAFRQTWFVAYE